MLTTIDLFYYHEPHRIWVCKTCQYAVSKRTVNAHLRDRHSCYDQLDQSSYRQIVIRQMAQRPWLDLITENPYPPAKSAPIPYIPIIDGLQCGQCGHVTCGNGGILKHRKQVHRGRSNEVQDISIPVQRVFGHFHGLGYYEVTPILSSLADLTVTTSINSLTEQVDQGLIQTEAVIRQAQARVPRRHLTEVSPWLDKTKWAQYLHG